MKKIGLLILLDLMLINIALCAVVDTAKAKTVATNFYLERISQDNQLKSLSGDKLTISLIHQESDNLTNLKGALIPYYYIFKVEDNSGFIIVSADDRIPPVLGYSLSGKYDKNNNQPQAFIEYMDFLKKQISYIKTTNYKSPKAIESEWSKYLFKNTLKSNKEENEVTPLISTSWYQQCYYNDLCPVDNSGDCGHASVGCVAVSMGQIMKYWNHPKSCNNIPGYTSDDYGEIPQINETTYDWANMPNVLNSSSTNSQVQAVATLLYHAGVSVQMFYRPNSSYPTENFYDALPKYFNYSSSIRYIQREDYNDSTWVKLIKNELDNNRPIIYRGTMADGSSGHNFICDGYQSNYFHLNWGFEGKYDGYFYLNNLFINEFMDFSYNQKAAIGIKPIYSNKVISICESEMPYSYNGVLFFEAGTKEVTLTSTSGYDSTITVTLNVIPTYTGDEDITICENELPFSYNGVIFNETGTKETIFSSVHGCDSIITIALQVHELPNPQIIANADTLTAFNNFFSYQWYNQDGIIEGATSNQYVIEKSGIYYLEVTNENGCSAMSNGMDLIKTDIEDFLNNKLEYTVIPNPNGGKFQLRFNTVSIASVDLLLVNPLGQSIEKREVINPNINQIEQFDISHLSKGIYHLIIHSDGFQKSEKIILQ